MGDKLESAKEETLLAAIKRMAVLVSNPMVHRNQMRDHRQGESEKVRGFVARVREAAVDCKFEVKCSGVSCGQSVSYKEEIIGLRDKETQAKILAMGKGLPTLEEVLAKAEAEEQTKLAQSKLSQGNEAGGHGRGVGHGD